VYVCPGRLSGCPGYVGLTVNSREDGEQLLRHDLLVLCPPAFNVTLRLPNWHQQTDKTLDLQLTDAHRTHLVFLTHLTFDPIAQGTLRTPYLLTIREICSLRSTGNVFSHARWFIWLKYCII